MTAERQQFKRQMKSLWGLVFVVLFLPGCQGTLNSFFSTPKLASYRAVSVQKGDTLYSIARRYDVNVRDLITVNGIKPPFKIYPGQGIRLPEKRLHIVRKFETVETIARDRHISQNELVRVNGLKPPYKLFENQRLKLPSPYSDNVRIGSIQNPKQSRLKTQNQAFVAQNSSPVPAQTKPVSQKGQPGQKVFKAGDESWKSEFVAPEPKPAARDLVTQKSSEPLLPGPETSPLVAESPEKPQRDTYKVATSVIAPVAPIKPLKWGSGSASSQTSASNQVATGPIQFKWPIRGKLLSQYGSLQNGLKNDGVNIKAKSGAAVRASETGTVVYSGNALKGYGNLVLMKHRKGYITTYAHLKSAKIRKGQVVKRGQILGYIGSTGNVKSPQLHFEIRKKRQTLDPIKFLK